MVFRFSKKKQTATLLSYTVTKNARSYSPLKGHADTRAPNCLILSCLLSSTCIGPLTVDPMVLLRVFKCTLALFVPNGRNKSRKASLCGCNKNVLTPPMSKGKSGTSILAFCLVNFVCSSSSPYVVVPLEVGYIFLSRSLVSAHQRASSL